MSALRCRTILSLGLAAAALLGGCATREADTSKLSDEEVVLMQRLERDPFVIVTDQHRNGDGRLVVTTHQGNAQVRYLFAPDDVTSKVLKIRRMVEDFEMEVGVSDQLGTGPAPRGLAH